jgi:fatty acid desaturase
MRTDHLLAHGARVAASAVAYVALSNAHGAYGAYGTHGAYGAGAALAGVGLFLAAFSFAHDLAHGALGLPARANRWLLSFAGAAMLTSGHAMRVAHLRHHAAPLAADDFEGAAVRVSFLRAVLAAPYLTFAARREAWRRGSRQDRRWQLAEHVVSLVLALVVVGRTYALVALLLQLFAPVWAGRLPHTAPRWLVRAARALAWTRSVSVLSLAFHDEHHEHPKVPTLALRRLAAPL